MDIQQRIDALEPLACHNVPVAKLMEYCNPFQCWPELTSEITHDEVRACLARGEAELVDTPLALELSFSDEPMDLAKLRANHIKKIAYFVENAPTQSIGLDVGLPDLGCYVHYFVDDGNHRLAGSIIAQRDTIACNIGGSLEHMKELGLWYPNEAYLKLDQLYRQQAEQRFSPGL